MPRRSRGNPATRTPAGLVVIVGLCGALTASVGPSSGEGQAQSLEVTDTVIFQSIVDETGRYTFDPDLVRAMHAVLPSAKLVHACTSGHVVTRATERAALAAAYSAEAVDMEGTHIVRALTARGRTSLIIRVVSDNPAFDLPPIEGAFTAGGNSAPST